MKSPDHTPSTPDKLYDFPGRRNLPLSFLTPEAIGLLRERQHEELRTALKDIDPLNKKDRTDAEKTAYAKFPYLIEEYLQDFGIDRADPKWDQYVDILTATSVNDMSDQEWVVGGVVPVSSSSGTARVSSGRERIQATYDAFVQDMNDEYNAVTKPAGAPGSPGDPAKNKKTPEEIEVIIEKDPAVVAARQNVENLRSKLAELSARRQGRLFTREGGSLREEYDTTQAAYQQAVSLLIRTELDTERTAGNDRDEDEERLEASFRVIKQFHSLQTESVERLKNTKVGKSIEWLTRGGTVKRIAKGVLVGAAVGAVGAAITAFTLGTAGGAVGAGLAVAGTRAAALARGFATFDNQEGRGLKIISLEDGDDSRSDLNERILKKLGAEGESRDKALELVHQRLMRRLEKDTHLEQKKRRKSTLKALGALVIGAALVEGVSLAVDAFSGYIDKAQNVLLGSEEVQAHKGVEKDELPARAPEDPQPRVTPEKVYTNEAWTINSGEGFYQTFEDLGVPSNQWPDLLEKVGPQLHEIQVDGHPLAYRMPNGEWGIRMTSDGQMPKEALDAISRTYDDMSRISVTPASNIEVPTDSSVRTQLPIIEAAPVEPPSIDSLTNPVDRSVQNIIHKEVIQPSDIQTSPEFMAFTHVTGMTPEMMGQRLGLLADDWEKLQDYIAQQVTVDNNPLYKSVFTVSPDGYLRFTVNDIPPNTLADILTKGIPLEVRARL